MCMSLSNKIIMLANIRKYFVKPWRLFKIIVRIIYNFRLQNWKSNQLIKHSNSFQLVVQSVNEIDKKNGLLNCRYCMKTPFFLSPFWNYIFSFLYITPNSSPFYVNWIFYWYALNVDSLSKIPSFKQFVVNKSVRKRDSFSKWE